MRASVSSYLLAPGWRAVFFAYVSYATYIHSSNRRRMRFASPMDCYTSASAINCSRPGINTGTPGNEACLTSVIPLTLSTWTTQRHDPILRGV
jgi:hypothetical protein